jgi:hypothetical protein
VNFMIRLLNILTVFFIVTGIIYLIVYGDESGIIGVVLLFATAIFMFLIAVMLRAAPVMEYLREHQETTVERGLVQSEAKKERLALPPPPPGVHIPSGSLWPIALSVGGFLVGLGLVFEIRFDVFLTAGIIVLLATGAGWAVQAWAERQHLIDEESAHHH